MAARLLANLQPTSAVERLPHDTIGHLPQQVLSHIAAEMHRIASQPMQQPHIPDAAPRILFGQGNLRGAASTACHAIVVAFSITADDGRQKRDTSSPSRSQSTPNRGEARKRADDGSSHDHRRHGALFSKEADATADEPMDEPMDVVTLELTREMVDSSLSIIFAEGRDECSVEELLESLFNSYAVVFPLDEVEPILHAMDDDNVILCREDDSGDRLHMRIHLL